MFPSVTYLQKNAFTRSLKIQLIFFFCIFALSNRRDNLSIEFSSQVYWNGEPFPSSGNLSNPGIKSGSPALQADSSLSEPPGRNHYELEVIQVELYLSGFHRGNIFPSTRAPGSISLVLTAFFQGLHFFP